MTSLNKQQALAWKKYIEAKEEYLALMPSNSTQEQRDLAWKNYLKAEAELTDISKK